jgi:glutathione peroxidase
MQTGPQINFYDIDCIDISSNALPLRQFSGRPFLIVNTASLCGYADQFSALESIWQINKDQGLVVLGVPSNDFGHQEPGTNTQIVSTYASKFGITFPLMAKTPVTGPSAHPLFQWLAREGGFLSKPRWNFYKYIVDRQGHLANWYSNFTKPAQRRFNNAIAKVIVGDH